MTASPEQAPKQGFIERTARAVRNFMIGALALEATGAVLVPFVDLPGSIVGAEALAAIGSELILQSADSKHNQAPSAN